MDVRHNNNALKELNDCIRGLLHLGPNVITFRTLLHLGQLLHLGLQQRPHWKNQTLKGVEVRKPPLLLIKCGGEPVIGQSIKSRDFFYSSLGH